MRIYLPATAAHLAGYPASTLEPAVAFAATRGLAAALPDEDEEAVEFSAFLGAADTSVELLAEARVAGESITARRVVIAVDVPDRDVRPDTAHGHPGAVVVGSASWAAVVAVHLDEPDAASDVELALSADEAATERLAERDLLWYDPSELARLAADLR